MRQLSLEQELFTLPSEGRVYGEALGLVNGSDVQIRSLVASDQKHMAGDVADQYRMYVQMLSRYVVQPENISVDLLLLSDAVAILYARLSQVTRARISGPLLVRVLPVCQRKNYSVDGPRSGITRPTRNMMALR